MSDQKLHYGEWGWLIFSWVVVIFFWSTVFGLVAWAAVEVLK